MKTNKFLLVLTAGFMSLGAFAQTADEVVNKHIDALGGLEKIGAVKTIYMERSMGMNGMDIPMKTTLVVGKSLRNELTVMANTIVQVIDQGKGWMIRPTAMGGTGEPEDLPDAQLKMLAGTLDPFGELINYKEKGNKVELLGKEQLEKKEVFHLKLTTAAGQVSDQYIDAGTFLLKRVKASANGQDGQVDLSDYKEVGGIKMPYTMDIGNAQGSMTFVTNKITVNSPVDEALFKRTK